MIVNSFRSEWVKLRRRNFFFGTFGGLTLAASFFSILMFTQAPATGEGGGGLPSLQELALPNGLIHGVTQAIILLGIVAFGIAASQVAMEFSLGTLRQLLVREPRRAVLLIGKYLALISFVLAAVIFASFVTGGVSIAMAHARHVPTHAWFTSTGIHDLTKALGTLLLAVIGFATLGFAAGLFLRSSVLAVIVGFAYLVPVENVVEHVWLSARAWLPGNLLNVVGQGGTGYSSLGRALVISVIYLAVIGALASVTFLRRDITA